MDQIDQTKHVAEQALAVCGGRLPDAAKTLFAAWLSLVHADGLPPAVQAALINTGMMELKDAIRTFNEANKPTAH